MIIQKILLIVPGGIGNMIMFTPVIQSLHNQFSGHTFDLLTRNSGADAVVAKCPYVDRIIIVKNIHDILNWRRTVAPGQYDMAVASMGINQLKAGALAWLSRARIRAGEDGWFFNRRVKSNPSLHEVDRNLAIIDPLVRPENITHGLTVWTDSSDKTFAADFLRSHNPENCGIIGIHAGSGGGMTAKRWPAGRFAGLIRRVVAETNSLVLVFGSPAEKELEETVVQDISSDRVIGVTGRTTLTQAAELIRQTDVMISNDSGLMHVAVAMETFVIALFGPTIAAKNRPYTDNAVVIQKDIDCIPCYRINKRIICRHGIRCLTDISIDEVFREVIKVLKILQR